MIKNYYKAMKELRLKKGITQADVAEKIGISRSSYIAFEQGKTDLSFSEAAKLADLFGLSLCDVEGGMKPNYDKYKEMILVYLRQGGSRDGKILKTKLAKMLYLADFAWFYEHLESMSGMQYRRLEFGPVPDIYFRAVDELEMEGKVTIERKGEMILLGENDGSKKQGLEELSKNELALIGKIAKKWKDKNTSEIVDFTHNQLPYKICSPDEIIPYELITQEDPDYVY